VQIDEKKLEKINKCNLRY